ncbi:Rv3235 family protein [Sphaerisporangium perillae]|uniref:Rv3235 family protein n=1 Tax=Sphaerisporangium perillae TaxID=2935860 RepID=UPI00200D6C53|nr:Rv3235 family protein [Sphaerisporangium perillae]
MPRPSRPVTLPRLRSVPPADPPYDDERAPGFAPPPPTQGALALSYDPPLETPAPYGSPASYGAPHETPGTYGAPHETAVAGGAPHERRVAGGPVREARPAGPRLRAAGSPPDERRLRGLGQALAEILAGRRSPSTVADRLTERAYAELVRAGKMIHTRRPPLVALPHVKQPRDGAVEACLLIHCGERSHVLALRLERHGVQWLCTEFETA